MEEFAGSAQPGAHAFSCRAAVEAEHAGKYHRATTGRSSDVHARTALRVRFRAAQHLAGDRGDLAVAEDEEADQVADRVALGPGEVGVRDLAGAVAEGEEDGGDRVRDRGT